MGDFLEILQTSGIFALSILILGILVNIGSVWALVVSFKRGTRSLCLNLGFVCLVSALVILLMAVVGFQYEWSLVQSSICANPQDMAILKLKGFTEASRSISFGLHLFMLPLAFGIALVVRGLMTQPSADQVKRSRLSLPVGLVATAIGTGLCVWALVDYANFDDFLFVFFWAAGGYR
jgi:hypothetical protein